MTFIQTLHGAAGAQSADHNAPAQATEPSPIHLEGSYFAEHGCRSLALDALIDAVQVIAFDRDPHDRLSELEWLEGREAGVLSSQTCFEWITSSNRDISSARASFQRRLNQDPAGLLKALRAARSRPEMVGSDLDSAETLEPYTVNEYPRERFGSH